MWSGTDALPDLCGVPQPTVVNDVVVHEVLQQADGRGPIRSLFVAQDPVHQLLSHEAVGIGAQVVASVLDQLPVVKPQPWGQAEAEDHLFAQSGSPSAPPVPELLPGDHHFGFVLPGEGFSPDAARALHV